MNATNLPSEQAAEAACDVRFGQVGLANVRVLADDPVALREQLAARVAKAPALFERTAVVLDLGHLSQLPDDARVSALLEAVRAAGMLPVGLAYGSQTMAELAQRLQLPVIAKFRDAYRKPNAEAVATQPAAKVSTHDDIDAAKASAGALIHEQQVRSGQQLYADQRDLVITAAVAHGAEVIADGCIHIYDALHGRALAGAQGDHGARIFCSDFRAQLVSIAGHYRVFEELPEQFAGKAVQCWLQDDKLRIAAL